MPKRDLMHRMLIALASLAGVVLAAGCSGESRGPASPVAGITATSVLSPTTTAPIQLLSEKWAGRLSRRSVESCDGANAFTVACAEDAAAMVQLAKEVKGDADSRGATSVSLAADNSISSAQMWTLEGPCLTSVAGTSERLACTKELFSMRLAGEQMLSAMYAYEA